MQDLMMKGAQNPKVYNKRVDKNQII